MRTLCRLAFGLSLLSLNLGCLRQKAELVPTSEVQPLMTYENSSPRFSLKVLMYAPGNLLFQVENLLPDFSLTGLPEITSPTGRIVQARLIGQEAIEFNVLLPGDGYVHSPNDVKIPWVLAEKGPGGFLRSEGEILVDIASTAHTKYFVRAVRCRPVGE